MRNTLLVVTCSVVALSLPELGLAQVRVQPDVQPDKPGVAIDGAWFPIPPGVRTAGQRIAREAVVDVYILPDTRPAAPDAGSDVAGYVAALPPDIAPVPNWSEDNGGGHVWTVEFVSAGAEALRVRFRGRFGMDELELRVYDPYGGSAFGPYEALYTDENDHWWTTIIFGDSIGLEFHVPEGAVFPPDMPEFDGIAYNNVPPPPTPRPEGCGLESVVCYPGWLNTAEAVCMLATIDSNQNVTGYCSGALLNRNPSDGSPLVMTANHCGTGSRFTVFVWDFQNSACPPGPGDPPNASNKPRSEGAWLLRRNSASDWNLLGLAEPPRANVYLGWDSGFWNSFNDGTGIHHPSGMTKSISLGYNEGALYAEFCDANGQNCFWAHVWGVRWTTGTTLPGSSGSPVLDSDHRVRGTLTGGPNCDVAYYGRFAHAYDTLQPFLNDIARPVYVDVDYGGPESGTSAEPFDQMIEATYCVVAGDTVRIRAGNYNERFRIWRPMRLVAEGGLVRIGAP